MRLTSALLVCAAALACNQASPKARAPDAGVNVAMGTPGADHGKFKSSIEVVAKDLAKDPCKKQQALQLGDLLNRAGDYQGALAWVAHFRSACGEWPRLLWVAQYADEQTEQWKDAAAVATEIIRSDPHDSDYWWWRGQADWKSGNLGQAQVDFLQSMANKPTGYPAARATGMAREHAESTCLAALLLQYLVEQSVKNAGTWAAKDRTELWLKGGCGTWAGTGKAVIPTPATSPMVTTPVLLNGKKGTFIFAPDLGPTVVTRAFAEAAKVTVKEGTPVSVWLTGDYAPAQPATLDSLKLGGAEVKALEVGVVESLPPGVDGMVGLSALLRFSVKLEGDKVSLTPLPK